MPAGSVLGCGWYMPVGSDSSLPPRLDDLPRQRYVADRTRQVGGGPGGWLSRYIVDGPLGNALAEASALTFHVPPAFSNTVT